MLIMDNSCDLTYTHHTSRKELVRAININRLVKKELSIKTYFNATIEALGEANALLTKEDERYIRTKVDSQKEICVFLGYFVTCWGHVLTDGFKKMWFFETDICKDLIEEGVEFVYVTTKGNDILQANIEILELAGIDTKRLKKLTRNTRYEKVIVPDDCFWGGIENTQYTEEYVNQINHLRNILYNDSTSTIEKVYFTRTELKDKRDYGEKAIESVFRKMGYTVFAPERLSVKEQLSLIVRCNFFAATDGSIAHISIFCQPTAKVTIIRKADYINGYQFAINQVAKLNVTYLDAHESRNVSTQYPWTGPFYLCINSLVEKYVGHKIFHIPYYLRPSWWWYMNKNRKIVHRIKNLFSYA